MPSCYLELPRPVTTRQVDTLRVEAAGLDTFRAAPLAALQEL